MPYIAHLKALESFEFIYVLVALQRSLIYLKNAAVKLQGENQDIISGYALIEQCITDLTTLRGNVDEFSQRIFQHSCRIAEKSEITVAIPRVSQRQRHRSNPECESADQYHRCTIVIPLRDPHQ